ncbi:aminotransferase-like domain-containing protein [Pseudonocardia sp. HH130630-07]|uniref:aminotransferase-like domain-containing protein n=1 Tax=Pseudonocardia sp. HH130630-07 TaxID=1690815 RepID=UPI0008153404|nr:PLP-dependent aminotransferase family protein [Pseudonocardia sp. HH130630-07]ANY07998.1 GntR family transcriptional regulator [Pseudonocardia sp. HH130630-07]
MFDDSAGRIAADLRRWIDGAPPGARLPSSRALVTRFGASPVTVQRAVRELVGLGLVESRPGVGTFVRTAPVTHVTDHSWQTAALRAPYRQLPAPPSPLRGGGPDTVALGSGYPAPDLLPERLLRTAFARAGRTSAVLRPPQPEGLPALRAWFARQIEESTPTRVVPPSSRDVLIVPGSQSALSSIFRSLIGPGGYLVLESPTYWGAIVAAAQAGVRTVPVAATPAGPDPDELSRLFATTGARVFYAQPTFANPTGYSWSAERRTAVLEIARTHGAFVVEDDWAHDFGITAGSRPLVADDGDGHVVYLRSLTKSVSPAVRVAALIARGPARDRIAADQAAGSMYVSDVLQEVALDVVTQPGQAGRLRALRRRLRTRRDHLLGQVREHVDGARVDSVPDGGLHLWVQLPDDIDLDRLAADCEVRGVLLAPGDGWFPAEAPGRFLRLCFAAADPGRFADATQVIAEAVRSQR